MKKKLLFILIIVVAIGGVVVYLSAQQRMKNTPTQTTGGLAVTTDAGIPGGMNLTPAPTDEFSSLLSNINRITIDTSLFQNSSYKALRDYPVTLGTDIVGRVNPFAPLGTDVGGVSTAPVVQTLQPGKITATTGEFGATVSFVGDPVGVVFEYGTSDTFGTTTTPVTLTKSGTALFTVKQLAPETTYFVRAVAVRGADTTTAQTMSFTTPKATIRR